MQWRSQALRGGCVALFVASAALQLVPQTNLLNYYFAFCIALVLPLAVMHVIVRIPTGPASPLRTRDALAYTTILLLIPLIPLAASALYVQNCAPGLGLLHYLLGPGVGALVALGTAMAVRTYTSKYRASIVTAIWMSLLCTNLYWFHTRPPIYAFNLFVGFLHGAIYDPVVTIHTEWWQFRVVSLLVGICLIAVSRVPISRRMAGRSLVLVIYLSALAITSSYQLSGDDIASMLAGRYETEHFTLIYDEDSASDDWVRAIARDHEFRYDQLSEQLGIAPTAKITSFIYRDSHQKQQLMGAGRTYIAKPWSRMIHLNHIQVGAPVLKHELVHIFGAELNSGWLGIPTHFGVLPMMAIVEGFAVAQEFVKGRLTVHQWSAAMYELGIAPNMDELLSPAGFLAAGSSKAYTLTGSFLSYLSEQYGEDAVASLYAEGDFESAFPHSLKQLTTEWKRFLADRQLVQLSASDRKRAEFRFDMPSRFYRTCALEIADWEQQGRAAFANQSPQKAISLFQKVYDFDRSIDKHLQLMLALMRGGEYERAKEQASAILQDERAGSVIRARALQTVADIHWLNGDTTSAHEHFIQLQEMPTSQAALRRNTVAAYATSHTVSPALGTAVRDYLTDLEKSRTERLATAEDMAKEYEEDGVVRYLLARQLTANDATDTALQAYQQALALGLPAIALTREAHMQMGHLLRTRNSWDEARESYRLARSKFAASGYRLTADDWIQRCIWEETNQ